MQALIVTVCITQQSFQQNQIPGGKQLVKSQSRVDQ